MIAPDHVTRLRDTLIKLDLCDLTLNDSIRFLSRSFAAGYAKAIFDGPISDIQPGDTIDALLKSITFP